MRYLSWEQPATDKYMRAEVEAAREAMEVGEAPEGGGPRQYRRAEVEAVHEAMEVGEAPEGEARDNTGGRR